jgi:hypothetical protein
MRYLYILNLIVQFCSIPTVSATSKSYNSYERFETKVELVDYSGK